MSKKMDIVTSEKEKFSLYYSDGEWEVFSGERVSENQEPIYVICGGSSLTRSEALAEIEFYKLTDADADGDCYDYDNNFWDEEDDRDKFLSFY